MLKNRLISSLFLIPAILAMMFLLSTIEFEISILSLCILMSWEWSKLSGFSSLFSRILIAGLFSLLLLIMIFLSSDFHLYQHYISRLTIVNYSLWFSIIWWGIAFFLLFFYPSSTIVWKNSKTLRLIFGLLIVIPFFWGTVALHSWNYVGESKYYGSSVWLFYVVNLVWGIDSGAYLFGKLFGKHKLAPKISPEKTWQGFIGSFIIAAVISYSYSIWFDLDIKLSTLMTYSFIIVLTSFLGDLTESMFKREAKIKDSGCLIPGHGGILDRVDSLTSTVPIFTFLLSFNN